MSRKQRIMICIVAIIMLVLLCLFSCLSEKEEEDLIDMLASDISSTPVPTRVIVIPLGDGEDNSNSQRELITIRYYVVSSANTPNQAIEVGIDSKEKVSPQLVLEYFIDSLEDEELSLGMPKITENDGICNVDFDDSIYAISRQNAMTEVHILDAISMSILDNCDDIKGISFSINGGRYETDNIILNEGEVYLSD